MLAIKNRAAGKELFFLAWVFILVGCAPPGPRALLAGKRLMEKGRYEQAVARLQKATSLLATNAVAWNCLGMACQHAGQFGEAALAYQKALILNRDLAEARYNLGCLRLEQNQLGDATTELTAFTLRRGNSAQGWLKLGEAQLRSRNLNEAVKCFKKVLQLSPQQPQALNGLGLVLVQRSQPRKAAQYFAAAVQRQPDYAPALLNLAIVNQTWLKDWQSALKSYRAYLALKPRPPNATAVEATMRTLEQANAPKPRPQPTSVAAVHPARRVEPDQAAGATKAAPRVVAQPKTQPAATQTHAAQSNLQVVRVEPEPHIQTSGLANRSAAEDLIPPPNKAESEPAKRGFFQRVTPLNFFHHEKESPAQSATLASGSTSAAAISPQAGLTATAAASASNGASGSEPGAFPRYAYHSPPKPAPGDRGPAERYFAQGVEDYQMHRFADAIRAYRAATRLDPAYFAAYYNLGLAAGAAGDFTQSLEAYEYALALKPDSVDARYNFALTLRQANYPLDAVRELQKILAENPREPRAHLALANLYAQQLHQPDQAREHYRKVLEYDPDNSQATAIRFWLSANPR